MEVLYYIVSYFFKKNLCVSLCPLSLCSERFWDTLWGLGKRRVLRQPRTRGGVSSGRKYKYRI